MAQAKKQSTQVAEQKGGAVSATPDFDFMADSGAGMETADKESFAIPFLRVIQKMSPEVDEADGKYIEEAKPGMLMNSVTSELFDGKSGVHFLPCAYQRRFIRWGPRGKDSGGYKGEYLPEEIAAMRESGDLVEHEGRLFMPDKDGNVDDKTCDVFSDTRNHFGLIYDAETGQASQALLSLTSTQIKKSKQLMSMLNQIKVKTDKGMVTPPTWMNKIRINTIPESNDQGTWHGIKFSPDGFIQDAEVYEAGKNFHALVSAGEAEVKYADDVPESGGANDKF